MPLDLFVNNWQLLLPLPFLAVIVGLLAITRCRTIARNTFIEAVRQPIFVVLLLIGGLLMLVNPFLASYSMEPGSGDNQMLIDLGLGTLWMVGIIIAMFSATGAVCGEMESHTALTVVSKPVPRLIFVLGKFIGISGAILLANYILLIGLLFTVRHRVLQNASDPIDIPVIFGCVAAVLGSVVIAAGANYLYGRVFTSTFTGLLAVTLTAAFGLVMFINKDFGFQSPITDWQADHGKMIQIAVGSGLIVQAVLIVTAFGVAFSTRMGQVMSLLACVLVIILGLGVGVISQIVNETLLIQYNTGFFASLKLIVGSDEGLLRKSLFIAAKCLYAVTPNFQFHWPSDAISQGNSLVHDENHAFSLSYISMVSLYTGLYVSAVLALGIALFQKREVS